MRLYELRLKLATLLAVTGRAAIAVRYIYYMNTFTVQSQWSQATACTVDGAQYSDAVSVLLMFV